MSKLKFLHITIILVIGVVVASPTLDAFARPMYATSPPLGALASYSVLAGSTVTCTGPSFIDGDVGVSPGTAINGFPAPCTVGPPGSTHSNDASAIAAQVDNVAVFGFLDQTCDQTFGAVDLTATFPGGVGPGVYCSTSSFSLSGNLTLLGSGVWIFKTASTLITAPGSSVTGGDACDIWWRVGSSATLDTTTIFKGNIFALTSITLNNGAYLDGRAFAQTGAVTLENNDIPDPGCAVLPTYTPTSTPSDTPSNTPSNTLTPSNTPTPSITPTPSTTPTPSNTPTITLTRTPTITPTRTPSALPDSGFAEDVGAPGLLIMAGVLLVVIFMARRLRSN